MNGLVIAGWFPRAKRPVGRPPGPPPCAVALICSFCRNRFEWTGRRDREPMTCSVVCAARLRAKERQAAGLARIRAERAARFLVFPKEAITDV